jgi:Protein of unknown function (DUF692)
MQPKPLIATPISHLFENEAYAHRIIENSDCLELRQRSFNCIYENQKLFHIDIDLTQPWDNEIKEYLVNAISQKTELDLITFQATRCCSGETIVNGVFEISGTKFSREDLLNFAKDNIHWIRSWLHSHIKIGFENNNYYPTEAYEIITESEFIKELVIKNQVYLLLDIAHAMVTAHNQKRTYISYIEDLPMEKCIQLHICQPMIQSNQVARDTHDLPTREMLLEAMRLVTKYPNIRYLTVEYYKEVNGLIEVLQYIKSYLG